MATFPTPHIAGMGRPRANASGKPPGAISKKAVGEFDDGQATLTMEKLARRLWRLSLCEGGFGYNAAFAERKATSL
jgi:hypothetical protein